MDYFIDALKQYAIFEGRATRTEYWMYILFYMIISIALNVIDYVLGTMILSTVFGLGLLIPSISICTRRLHDTGRTGWWQLILLVPLIGVIVLLVFMVSESHEENEYGPGPDAI
ncbi:MAG: DUF805 domain-containing protein [Pseudomonadales bacterium]|nr:DUF805 domain-containing protein [Pseudomonadales bacterium]